MIDVFNEEIEIHIKNGIANLYWFRGDLEKCWLKSGVDKTTTSNLFSLRKDDNSKFSKRELMDMLYKELRGLEYNRRLEVSRNFVRILVEHKNFVPQDEKHKIQIAETCSLKLLRILEQQRKDAEYNQTIKANAQKTKQFDYESELLSLRERFSEAENLEAQARGYAFETLFVDLMRISGVSIWEPFKIVGEQIDGAIKYDGHYYLIELKWVKAPCNQAQIASLYLKTEGKMETRGIFIAMNGFSSECLQSLPQKNTKVLLLDGIHFTNVIMGLYTFQQLLEHSLTQASLKNEIYCAHNIRNT